MKVTNRSLALFLLISGLAMASPQPQHEQTPGKTSGQAPDQASVMAEPSLGEAARAARERRAEQHLTGVPLYTNDDLPAGDQGISVLGPSNGQAAGPKAVASSARMNLRNEKMMAYLRGKLARLQQEQQLHQRELSVLDQQISQSKMQWSPNPNEVLRQEYSRQNVNNLASEIDGKKAQIAEGQQEIQQVQDTLQRAQARFGWLSQAAPTGQASAADSALPPGLTPGSPEYWQARVQVAKQRLATAKEQLSLAKNELSLLKLQRLRSLDPNLQASLASAIPQKQSEVGAAAEGVTQAEQSLETTQKEAQAAAAAHK